ncbi:MAG: ABC transporter permease [Kosmotogaceae bacterium]
MFAYIIRRLLMLPLIMFGVTLLAFSMIWSLGPDVLFMSYVTNPKILNIVPETKERLIRKYGLDDPLPIAYYKWLGNMAKGDWGYSFTTRDFIYDAIMERLPKTLELVFFSITFIILLGIAVGTGAAKNYGTFKDDIINGISIVGWSIPEFIMGLIVFTVILNVFHWFPKGPVSPESYYIIKSPEWHTYTNSVLIDSILNLQPKVFLDGLINLIEPTLTLVIMWGAYVIRMTRASIIEVMHFDYIRTARSKGLKESTVLKKHARRNALIPITTVSGNVLVQLIGGVVVVEAVFNRPGIGNMMAKAGRLLDHITVVSCALVLCIFVVVINIIVDITYSYFNPRVRLY